MNTRQRTRHARSAPHAVRWSGKRKAIAAVVALSIAGIAFGSAALIVVRPHATHTVPLDAREWTEALTSSDPRRREEVLSTYALTAVDGAMPPPCDPLIARLADQPEVRNDALGVLIKEARARRCVTEVIGILADSPVPYVRAAAAHVLGEVSAASLRTPVVDALLRAVSHDTSARDAAIVALGILNDSDPQVLLALQRAFAGTRGETRGDALEALVHVEPEPERLEPLAVAALGDTSADVRAVAVLALERIGARPNRAPAIVDRLVGRLADPAPEVRARSADAIGWIGIGNASVFRALDIAGRDTSARVSAAVRRALQALRPAP